MSERNLYMNAFDSVNYKMSKKWHWIGTKKNQKRYFCLVALKYCRRLSYSNL